MGRHGLSAQFYSNIRAAFRDVHLSLWCALLPPALYFGIHLVEGETLTPMLLARRFTLNPVLVILALVFWFWMWGVLGAILAVPMLAILKIICDRLRPLKALGHFLEGE